LSLPNAFINYTQAGTPALPCLMYILLKYSGIFEQDNRVAI